MSSRPSRHLAAVLVLGVVVLMEGPAAGASVRVEPGVRMLAKRDGFLTGPSGARPARVAIDYLRRRAAAFGLDSGDVASLELTRRYTSGSGATHLQWQQTFDGIRRLAGGSAPTCRRTGDSSTSAAPLRPT